MKYILLTIPINLEKDSEYGILSIKKGTYGFVHQLASRDDEKVIVVNWDSIDHIEDDRNYDNVCTLSGRGLEKGHFFVNATARQVLASVLDDPYVPLHESHKSIDPMPIVKTKTDFAPE